MERELLWPFYFRERERERESQLGTQSKVKCTVAFDFCLLAPGFWVLGDTVSVKIELAPFASACPVVVPTNQARMDGR